MGTPLALERYLDRRERGTVRQIVTPEGVPLNFTVAAAGARVWAFFLDGLVMILAMVVLGLACLPLATVAGNYVLAFLLISWFLVRHFYFVALEIRWQGMTIGKRSAGIRVVDRHGGPLTAEAVFARNLTREIEFFLPLIVLRFPQLVFPGRPAWAVLVAMVWLVIVAFLPLLNRDRLRLGDIVAGTIVVLAPRAFLLGDITGARRASVQARTRQEFTPDQLDIYGIFELQVLEDVLRGHGEANQNALHAVAERIKVRIGWDGERWNVDPRRFLEDFYDAQRGRLEKRMLLGDRRESKSPRR